MGGASGLLVAVWGTRLIAALDAGVDIPLLDQTRVDLPVAVFTVVTSALSALLFGTLPAWHAANRLDIMRGIREDGGTTTGDRDRQRLRSGLIVVEAALSVVLLVGAGLLMRSFLGLTAVDLGFDPARIQTFSLSLPATSYATPAARASRVDTLHRADCRAPGRGSRCRRLRPAALGLQLRHLDLHDRRPKARRRRTDASPRAASGGHARLFPGDGHSDARGPVVRTSRRPWRPSGDRREPGGRPPAVARASPDRPEHHARHAARARRAARRRHGGGRCRRRPRSRSRCPGARRPCISRTRSFRWSSSASP